MAEPNPLPVALCGTIPGVTMYSTAGSKPKTAAPAIFVRYAGIDRPVAAVAQAAAARGDLPVTFLNPPMPGADYCLIDRALAVAEKLPAQMPAPAPGLGYGGLSAVQRGALLAWLQQPQEPAPAAFQQLLLANAEVRLLEGEAQAAKTLAALLQLAEAPAWQGHAGLVRTLLLAFWLRQDGGGLGQWLAGFPLPDELWRPALGLQAALGQPLGAGQLGALAGAWQLPAPAVHTAVLRLRLDSLQTALGQEPLAYALGKLGEAARAPLPWRCHHRDLRLALPQPDVRGPLEPLLRDLLIVIEPAAPPAGHVETADTQPAAESTPAAPAAGARAAKRKGTRSEVDEKPHLILEFGASRSDVFDYVLRQAQKQPGFLQIMDENRHMVYRVPFRRSAMRHFWQLWTYVQNWSSTRVFYEGRQLDKWQVYPYSQYLR